MLTIDSLINSRALALYGLFSLVTAIVAGAWALFKLSFQRGAGRPLPRNAFTVAMDVLVDFAQNAAGAINRAVKLSGGAGIFLPTQPTGSAPVLARAELQARLAETERSRDALMRAIEESSARETQAPPAPRDGQRGSVGLGAAGYLLLLAVASATLLSACPASRQLTRPALGDVDGCEPRATRCSPTGRPQVCSGSRRWTDADQVCATAVQVAAVCCLTTSPITGASLHACVTADRCIDRDGGL